MTRIVFFLLLFCALKISAQSVGGEIKHSDNASTYKSTMTTVIKQKSSTNMERVSNWTIHLLMIHTVPS